MSTAEPHRVVIYYEDTDLSGYVYHPNYLKYFERAREHLLGVTRLARLFREEGLGFVVYRCELGFKSPAMHGDQLDIHTVARVESAYRMAFDQRAVKVDPASTLVVEGVVELVCVDQVGKLVRIPADIRALAGG